MDFTSTLAQVRALNIDDRIRLIHAILDDIASDVCPPLTEAQKEELDRRLADAEANPDDEVPWETVRAEASARARK
jgi:putative addiction module component (TIGR02574 family)